MNIQGLQKLTLLDYPEKVACTIFTGGCNFRCPFCHNASLVVGERGNVIPIEKQDYHGYTEEEVLAFLRKRRGVLDGVCITGGEPLVQRDIQDFIVKVRELGYLVKLDTNGSFPDKLKELAGRGLLDYVAMDIKNSKRRYGKTIGIGEYDTAPIEESVSFLMEGSVPYEFRTTVTREFHTEESMKEIGEWIEGAAQYYLQQFVDSGDLIQPGLHAVDEGVVREWVNVLKAKIPFTRLRGID